MQVPASIQLDLTAPDLVYCLAELPVSPGIYALRVPGQEPHLSSCSNLRTRLRRLLGGRPVETAPASHTLLQRLTTNSAVVECWPTSSRLESALRMHAIARQYFPSDYLAKLRLRLPWFLTFVDETGFPRLSSSNRISRGTYSSSPLFGPFLTRDLAQDYEQKLLGLFQIRRCLDPLVPSPEHPGCIYGEMSQCLRPCQTAVTSQEYASEVARVADFLQTNGKTLSNSLTVARDRAAAETDFEHAAYLHKRLERIVETAAARDPVIGEVAQFSGVALTHGLLPREFRLWIMLAGYWQEPVTLDFAHENSRPVSLDRELREKLHHHLAEPLRAGSPIEDIAIFSRWYYSSWRDGHWFPFRSLADLDYRKLVREISKMAKEEAPISPNLKSC